MGKTTIKRTKTTGTMVSENEFTKLIKITVGIIIVFAVFYLITVWVKKEENKEEPKVTTIQYEEILVGGLLKQNDDEYYVMAYRQKDKYVNLYQKYFSIYDTNYKTEKTYIPYYRINMDDGFNVSYIGVENINVSNVSDLRIDKTTLFHIKNGKINKAISDMDKIIEFLEGISKSSSK